MTVKSFSFSYEDLYQFYCKKHSKNVHRPESCYIYYIIMTLITSSTEPYIINPNCNLYLPVHSTNTVAIKILLLRI